MLPQREIALEEEKAPMVPANSGKNIKVRKFRVIAAAYRIRRAKTEVVSRGQRETPIVGA